MQLKNAATLHADSTSSPQTQGAPGHASGGDGRLLLCLSQKWVKLDKIMYCNVPQTARHNLRRQKHNVPNRQRDLSVCLKLADRMVARQAKQFEKSDF